WRYVQECRPRTRGDVWGFSSTQPSFDKAAARESRCDGSTMTSTSTEVCSRRRPCCWATGPLMNSNRTPTSVATRFTRVYAKGTASASASSVTRSSCPWRGDADLGLVELDECHLRQRAQRV